MERMSQPSVDRKSELLVIARRSRIKWIKDAGDSVIETGSRKLKLSPTLDKANPVLPSASAKKETSHDAFQRAFDLLTNIIADGETIDVGSLLPTDSMTDDEYNEGGIKSASTTTEMSLSEYTYPQFLLNLCARSNVAIVKTMQQFVSNFESKIRTRSTSLDEKVNQVEMSRGADSIWAFIDRIAAEIAESSKTLWSGDHSDWRELTRIYCEKFVFGKIYCSTFHSSFEDYFLNEKLSERIQSLSFLKPEHLDIKTFGDGSCHNPDSTTRTSSGNPSVENKWWLEYVDEAVSSILQLQYASCPHEKLNCIKRMSSAVERSLRSAHNESDGDNDSGRGVMIPIGADDVLPLLILCVKESNPPHLHSELKYLQTYLDPSQSCGEAGYLVTQIASAVNFLETVDATALTISTDEFNRSLRRVQGSEVPLRSTVVALTIGSSERSNVPKGLGLRTGELETGLGVSAMQNTSHRHYLPADHSAGGSTSRAQPAERSDCKQASSTLLEVYRSRGRKLSSVGRIVLSSS